MQILAAKMNLITYAGVLVIAQSVDYLRNFNLFDLYYILLI